MDTLAVTGGAPLAGMARALGAALLCSLGPNFFALLATKPAGGGKDDLVTRAPGSPHDLWAVVLVSFLLAGCTSQYYKRSADVEAQSIQDEKAAEVDEFRNTQLADPTVASASLESETPPIDVPEVLTLGDALAIATVHNRDYKSRRESFFLSALSLSLTRRDFLAPVFGGSAAYTASDGRRVPFADSSALNLSVSQFLYTGGTLTASTTGGLSHTDGGGGRVQSADLTGRVTLSQPLLRGGGHAVAFEGLTQAERDVLYDARDFELFRQSFAISIIEDYYGLVSQKRQITNLNTNIESQQRAVDQAKAFYDVGRGTQVDVFRAQQSFYATKNSVLDSQQAYEFSLDRFKIRLGLPTEVSLEIADDLPEELVKTEFDMSAAIAAAFQNRLDLLTLREQVADQERRVNVARNSLLPDLDLDLTYETGSDADRNFRALSFSEDLYSVSLALELPLNRKGERNAYRSALIALDRARRDLRQFEDSLVLEVRDSLRTLKQRRAQIEIEELNIESLRRRLRQAEIEHRAGLTTNRDVVEAQDQLTRARNQQLDRYVDYEITRLTLLRQLGILFVGENGRPEERNK